MGGERCYKNSSVTPNDNFSSIYICCHLASNQASFCPPLHTYTYTYTVAPSHLRMRNCGRCKIFKKRGTCTCLVRHTYIRMRNPLNDINLENRCIYLARGRVDARLAPARPIIYTLQKFVMKYGVCVKRVCTCLCTYVWVWFLNMATPSLEALLDAIPEEKRRLLDYKLESRKSRATIAKSITNWRVVAQYMSNIENDIDGIEHDNHSLEEQK